MVKEANMNVKEVNDMLMAEYMEKNIGNTYDMYKLGCLKDPCAFYGLAPDTMLIFAIFSATGTTAVVACGLNVACGNCFNVIPANGGAELQTWVMGGHCEVGVFSQSEIVDGIKPLCFLGETRSVVDALKNVPTIGECGYGDLTIPYGCFRGLAVPKGTPDNVKAWLADTVTKAFYDADFQAFLTKKGYLQTFNTLKDTDAYNQKLVVDLLPALAAAGLIK